SHDDFSGGLRLRAKRVLSLVSAGTALAESLRLRVDRQMLQGERLRWMAELFQRHKGACLLTLDYTGSEARAMLQFGDNWQVDPTDSLIQALRDQFGRDNVFLHYRQRECPPARPWEPPSLKVGSLPGTAARPPGRETRRMPMNPN